ncbi:MAG: hypothetical protein DRP45_03955 [Candidatus Zixiibacteriota bacterium]|nr:MAG: hypothetical protein DRP45_03955 [candidate division Zixibacteria bacterium]
MKVLLIALVGVLAVTASSTLAADYEITRVIEVGPAKTAGCAVSVRWSPDGTMLAYFANNHLMISDTLGNSHEVSSIHDLSPYRHEWVSDQDIAVRLEDRSRKTDSALNQLILYNIATGDEVIMEVYWKTRDFLVPGSEWFEGPFLSLERNAYYRVISATGRKDGTEVEQRESRKFRSENKSFSTDKDALAGEHVYATIVDGTGDFQIRSLYQTDSIKQCGHRLPFHIREHLVSADLSHTFTRGILTDLTDSSTTYVDDFAGDPPAHTVGCSYYFPTFNPRLEELLFLQACEGKEPYVVDRMCTFNYATNEFTDLGALTGLDAGTPPRYSPDGKKIAYTTGRKAYIIYREDKL